MDLATLCNVFGGRKHPKELVTMKELLQDPPQIPKKPIKILPEILEVMPKKRGKKR